MKKKLLYFKMLALLACMLCSIGAAAADAYACYTYSNRTLTFYYDNQSSSRPGTVYYIPVGSFAPGWYEENSGVIRVVFDSSFAAARPISTYCWFNGMYNLLSITGMEYLNTSNVTDMREMFEGCSSLTSLDLSHFSTGNVTTMNRMFYNCSGLMSLDLSSFNTSNVTDMNSMFWGCQGLTSLNVSSFNTAKVTNMYTMFAACQGLTSLDVSHFNTSQVTNMSTMFSDCSGLTSLDVSHFNTSKVTDMRYMFARCSSLTHLDVSSFNTSKVTNMWDMFLGCNSLTSLDLCSFNTTNVTSMAGMFEDCSSLSAIYASNSWNTVSVTSSTNMFYNCQNLVGGMGTTYNSSQTNATYAHIDGGTSNPGYFREKVIEAYACYTPENTTLTFYYDNQRSTRPGKTYDLNSGAGNPGWYTDGTSSSVTQVVFNSSFSDARPTSTCSWFVSMYNLQSITHMEYLNTSNVTDMSLMFFNCSSLTSLDLSNFNTVNVTNMNAMFQYCSGLTSLDLGSFNTAKVTNMFSMFSYCSGLTSLDLSNFNTANVTNMSCLFQGCTALTNLDVSSFNTSEVTVMYLMFAGCSGLTSLDLSSFNTAQVTDMHSMFSACGQLVTIYADDAWSTASTYESSQMFYGCTSLVGGMGTTFDANHINKAYAHIDGGPSNPGYFTEKSNEAYACYTTDNTTLTFYYDGHRNSRPGTTYGMNEGNDVPEWFNDIKTFVTAVVFDPSFDDARPQSTSNWFSNMKNLQSITGMEYLHTNEVRTMKSMFATCSKLTEIDLSHFYTANVTDMSGMFQFSNKLSSLDLSSFNTSNVTTMSSMFTNCSGLTSLDLSNFNTANVTQMVLMFQNCSHLTSLDLSSFNTANVTDMRGMFYNCQGLTSLDLGQFNTANVTDMSQMFRFCIGLTTIYVGNGWNTDNVTSSSYMFSGATDLVGGQGTTYDASHTDKEYAHIDGDPSNPGYFTEWKEAYACFTWDNRTLTFYYDGQRNSRTGTTYDLNTGISSPRWHNNQSNILYVVFDPSFADARPTTTYCWFYNMGYIRSITGMSYLNTSNVTDMSFMFDLCEKLTNLDVSGFNTANVTNMTCMFAECSGLTSLDVSGFNTSNVTNMRCMFYNCKRLSSLDVSGFNTSNVTSMYLMFYNCEGLTSLDVSGFNTSNVTDMSYMFDYCEQLTSLDVSGFNTSNVTNMSYMFAGCEALTSLDVSGFNTSNVTNMSYIFAGCEALTSLDVSGFNTSNVTDMFAMFAICETLPSLDVSGFNTSNVTNMSYMFAGCEALTSLDVSHFNTEKVTNMTALFSTCLGLSSLDVSNFNTANVTEMNGMFWGCTGLTSLDLSGFNTSNVTDMKEMFRGCSNLATIYVGSGWNTDALTVSDDMFAESTNLVGGMGTTYDADHVDAEYAHIDGGPSNPGYFSEPPEAYAVYTSNNKTLTFYYDTYRDSRPGTSFDMNTDGNPPAWSAGYGNVITQVVIDPSFAGARPTTTHCWFFDLAKVTSITGLNYLNTEAVTRMSYMFAYSPALESLDLSHFNTANVTDMESMFAGSTALESLDLTSFNTENVTGMSYMFLDCTGLKSLDLTSFNTAGVRQLVSMFGNCSNLTTIYAGSDWSTVNYISSAGMFDNCTSLVGSKGTAYDANHVDAEYAHIDGGPSNPGYFSDKSLMPEAYAVYTEDNTTLTFYYDTQRDIRPGTAYDLNTGNNQPDWIIDEIYESVNRVVIAPSFDYARPVSTYMWFYCMENVQSIEGIEYLNTSEATNMAAMFIGCSGLTNLDVSHFNTDKSTDMFNMFKECSSLTSLDLSSFNTAKVQDIRGMFQNCTGLTSLDLSGFNTAFVRSMSLMFYGCSHLTTIYAGDCWSNDALYTSSDMFQDCTALVGGKGTTYDASHTDAEYAHIDGGPSNPGYFTAAFTRGDVNGDGNVNIGDVTALIHYLLSHDVTGVNLDAADCSQDNNVNINDVTALIKYLLSHSW